ncbi:MAG: hypothetical protein WDN08_14305 [Rhizomicrobium sp.]
MFELSELQALADAGREARPRPLAAASPSADGAVQPWNARPDSQSAAAHDLYSIYLYGSLADAWPRFQIRPRAWMLFDRRRRAPAA